MIRKLLLALTAVSLTSAAVSAQATTAKRTYVPVCAKGVQIYTDIKDVPKPYDSLTVPAPPEPVRVSNEDEMEAAELAMRGRAGSIGATGVVVTDDRTDDGGGNVQIRRNLQGVYVASDSARAQKACGK
jgi:hypothetical protein